MEFLFSTPQVAKAYGVDIDGYGDKDEGDIRNLPVDIAMQIYKVGYWNGAGCDYYDTTYSIALFDTAVNCGIRRAKEWDRVAKGDQQKLLEQRAIHYITLSKNPKFRTNFKDWMNGLTDLKKYLAILGND